MAAKVLQREPLNKRLVRAKLKFVSCFKNCCSRTVVQELLFLLFLVSNCLPRQEQGAIASSEPRCHCCGFSEESALAP
jgi:hypothetical protein